MLVTFHFSSVTITDTEQYNTIIEEEKTPEIVEKN